MGNQNVKPSKRPAQVYPFNEAEKKSRTDWTAGGPSRAWLYRHPIHFLIPDYDASTFL